LLNESAGKVVTSMCATCSEFALVASHDGVWFLPDEQL